MPIARIGGNLKASTNAKQRAGSTMSWHTSAITTALGCFTTRAKSAGVNVSTRPSMMMQSARGNPMVVNADPIRVHNGLVRGEKPANAGYDVQQNRANSTRRE